MKTKVNWNRRKETIVGWYVGGGLSTRAIGEKLGVSHVTVCAYLDRWGVERRGGDDKRNLTVNDLVGRRFGKLTVIARDGVTYPIRWIVRCDCGKTMSYPVRKLRTVRSCGCAPRGPRRKR